MEHILIISDKIELASNHVKRVPERFELLWSDPRSMWKMQDKQLKKIKYEFSDKPIPEVFKFTLTEQFLPVDAKVDNDDSTLATTLQKNTSNSTFHRKYNDNEGVSPKKL